MTISYRQYFFRISKVLSMLHHGSVGKFTVNNATLYLKTLSWHFLLFFIKKICVFIIFISFFDEVSNFSQQNINQLETGIDDEKLSVELNELH